MTVLIDHQNLNLSNGVQNIGPVDIADGVNTIDFRLRRCTDADPTIWPNSATTLKFNIEVSFDGGTIWVHQAGTGSAAIPGGNIPGLTEVPIVLVGLPQTTGRRLRGTVEVANGPLKTEVTVQVE